jgi:glyoxylase-like metal-dependent hydrolase (beta-lactamase superfamily II)
VILATDAISPAGRWVTPHGSPVRFDARFFAARVPDGWEPRPDLNEVEDCRWMTAAAALEQLASGQTIMAPPTAAMLKKLTAFDDVESAIAGLSRSGLQSGEEIYGARLSPSVQIVLAPNPGLMTGPGTNTYVVGSPPAIVIDPAVDDSAYIDEIMRAAGSVHVILITHRHSDHVGGVTALAALTGAPVRAFGDEPAGGSEVTPLVDGELIETHDVLLETIYAPGHASDHVCFWLASENSLFAGDNVLGEGTSVIAPPDGDMRAYLDTLRRLVLFEPQRIYPGHFRPLDDGTEVLSGYARHRLERETKIVSALRSGPATLERVVEQAYEDTPVELHPVAQMSALAHLQALEADGRVRQLSQGWELVGVE